jgi:hypothetical protein
MGDMALTFKCAHIIIILCIQIFGDNYENRTLDFTNNVRIQKFPGH